MPACTFLCNLCHNVTVKVERLESYRKGYCGIKEENFPGKIEVLHNE